MLSALPEFPDLADLGLEHKPLLDPLPGAFQAINQEFLAREWAEWDWVNRE